MARSIAGWCLVVRVGARDCTPYIDSSLPQVKNLSVLSANSVGCVTVSLAWCLPDDLSANAY